MTASVASVSRSITSEADAGLVGDLVAEAVGIGSGTAGFGGDQPQPLGIFRMHLVAAECSARQSPRPIAAIADPAGRGDALAEANDPRKTNR